MWRKPVWWQSHLPRRFEAANVTVFFGCVCVRVIRLPLWSTCQRSCTMLRKYLMLNSSGKLTLLEITSTNTHKRLIFGVIQVHWQSKGGALSACSSFCFLQWPAFSFVYCTQWLNLTFLIRWWKSHWTDTETRTNTWNLSAPLRLLLIKIPLSPKS